MYNLDKEERTKPTNVTQMGKPSDNCSIFSTQKQNLKTKAQQVPITIYYSLQFIISACYTSSKTYSGLKQVDDDDDEMYD